MKRKMMLLSLILIVSQILLATIINVPADQPSIQAGLNVAAEGDTVFVASGTYYENLLWPEMSSIKLIGSGETNCIIDGNHNGRVISFNYYFESPIDSTTLVTNFTITNGLSNISGGGIYCYNNSSPTLENLTISNNTANSGGGISCHSSSEPILTNVTISNNSSTGTNYNSGGGGIYCYDNSNPSLENVTINGNSAIMSGGGIFCIAGNLNFSSENLCNIYSNTIVDNNRGNGKDICNWSPSIIDVLVDTFTVMTPTDYYASPIDNFTFNVLHSIEDDLINADVYVAVDGDDTNMGTSPNAPFKTIEHALKRIYCDSLISNTIHLASGVYSPSTNGEIFPIIWSSYVNLLGSGENETILDANQTENVMKFVLVSEALIENITITGGLSSFGGAIFCTFNSNPSFEGVTITNNYNDGICLQNSNLNLKNVSITNNQGNGIESMSSSTNIINSTISSNLGDGIYHFHISVGYTGHNLSNCIVALNSGYGVNIVSFGYSNIAFSDFYNNDIGNFFNCGDSIGVNITTNINGDSCDVFYNIQEDPLFEDFANGNYHLTEFSPCIDAGDPTLPFDPDETIADIGAFYYDQLNYIANNEISIEKFNLSNSPNPFNPSTTIDFSIQYHSNIELSIYNIKGQKIKTIVQNDFAKGSHSIIWNGDDESGKLISSGVYLYKLNVNGKTEVMRKCLLLK